MWAEFAPRGALACPVDRTQLEWESKLLGRATRELREEETTHTDADLGDAAGRGSEAGGAEGREAGGKAGAQRTWVRAATLGTVLEDGTADGGGDAAAGSLVPIARLQPVLGGPERRVRRGSSPVQERPLKSGERVLRTTHHTPDHNPAALRSAV